MLGFSVSESASAMDWCGKLAQVLFDHNIGASLFLVGKVADANPDAVWCFNDRVDVGSQTYDNLKLTTISDYSVKLEQVKQGKSIVDDVGRLNSQIFRAPYGATDGDIFSLLTRSGIVADFSGENSYSVYRDGVFVKYSAKTYIGGTTSAGLFTNLVYSPDPIIIYYDNKSAIADIEKLISGLEVENVEFVNASQLTGMELTKRGD
jgi:peptidoglycan/xylan/chitin deacetylase (PgdA/CDA1 family)